ncbi:MAG: glutamate synthase subunit beta [Peptococcaceae bacterium]|nr:glutamate synthase subunit beta [Peptococcaceae bacterium]
MGKLTGFLEYRRAANPAAAPSERIKHFNEFHDPLPGELRREQAARCMECGVPFCQSGMNIEGMLSGCPLNNLIPEWNDLLYTGDMAGALSRLLKTNNFPEFTSRVCPAPCESACTCGLHMDPITIKENEREIIEQGYSSGLIRPRPPKNRSGKKVAVIGSGPAGLAAADQLNKRGHLVTVFEKRDRIGGLLMHGIPNMKLEKTVIQRKVKLMEEEGVTFMVGADVGRETGKASAEAGPAAKIYEEYDAVLLACGSGNPRDIKAPGREGRGIHFAVDYLSANTGSLLGGKALPLDLDAGGKDVIIIGGGDTGNDCVGTALRQGARSVVQIEMMPQLPLERTEAMPWPIWPRLCKTDYGQEEAVAVFGKDPRIYCSTVKEFILDEKNAVKEAVIVRLRQEKDPETGRMTMKEVPGSEYTIPAGIVMIAAGFLGAQGYIAEAFGVELDGRTNVKTAPGRYAASRDKVFTAGDMHRGQSLVVWAIREGREAAREVDAYLTGPAGEYISRRNGQLST